MLPIIVVPFLIVWQLKAIFVHSILSLLIKKKKEEKKTRSNGKKSLC